MHALVHNSVITRVAASAELLMGLAEDGIVLPIVEDKPDYDDATQTLLGPVFTITDDAVVASYTVENLAADCLYAKALQDCQKARNSEYIRNGCTIEALVEALIEFVVEDRPEKLTQLQKRREEIKVQFRKPDKSD